LLGFESAHTSSKLDAKNLSTMLPATLPLLAKSKKKFIFSHNVDSVR